MDSAFVQHYDLPVSSVGPIELKLFDGTSNSTITQSLALPVLFLSGESMTIDFYVTLLDPLCSMVLGYNWLTHYNLLIDWALGSIAFCPQIIDLSFLPLMSSARAATLPPQNLSASAETLQTSVPHISLIGAATFMHASKLPGSHCYKIHLSDPSISTNSISVSDEAPDLSQVLKEYHDFANMFSKNKAFALALHRPYDLKIDLEEGATPPVTPMYPLSQVELQTLCEFIEEHLCAGFI